MKTLIIGDRIFDPNEIDHFELIGTILHIYYRSTSIVSKIKFDTFEEAISEYNYLPEYIKKILKKKK